MEQNIKEVSTPAFFMRIASLNDESEDDQEKNKLAALASNLVTALEVVVQVAPETDSFMRALLFLHKDQVGFLVLDRRHMLLERRHVSVLRCQRPSRETSNNAHCLLAEALATLA